MSVKDQVGEEKWAALINAPAAASTFISTASGGGLEVFREVLSASKFFAELSQQSGGSGYGSLVDEVLAAMKAMTLGEARENRIEYQSREPSGIRQELKQHVASAVAIAEGLPGGDGYKRWLLDAAREVAETRTGGFLGIGAKSVIDEQEQAAINELSSMFGM